MGFRVLGVSYLGAAGYRDGIQNAADRVARHCDNGFR